MKYSYELKLKAVLCVINDHLSPYRVAFEIGSCEKHVRRWVALYKSHGPSGLLHKRNSYSGEFKVSVIRYMYENHLSLFETSIKFCISDSLVHHWHRIYCKQGESGLLKAHEERNKKMKTSTPKQPGQRQSDKNVEEDLMSELQRLRAENAYLKKLQALVQERIARESRKNAELFKG